MRALCDGLLALRIEASVASSAADHEMDVQSAAQARDDESESEESALQSDRKHWHWRQREEQLAALRPRVVRERTPICSGVCSPFIR